MFLASDGIFRSSCPPDHAIFVSDEEIRATFEQRFGERLTDAELRLLKHLLKGRALSHGEHDGPGYNTRRKQLAVLRTKTGLSRQGEFVQVMTAMLLLQQLLRQ